MARFEQRLNVTNIFRNRAASWFAFLLLLTPVLSFGQTPCFDDYPHLTLITGATSGNDTLTGDSNGNRGCGEGGNDTISLLGGDDRGSGGDGDDFINGNSGNDFVNGNSGSDVILGGGGRDSLYGGQGNDIISGDTGDGDLLSGGGGTDIFVYRTGDGNGTVVEDPDNGSSNHNALFVQGTTDARSFRYQQQGNDLMLSGTGGGSVRAKDFYSGKAIRYLHAIGGQASAAVTRNIQAVNNPPYGYIDRVSPTRIAGWAFDPNDLRGQVSVRVEIFDNPAFQNAPVRTVQVSTTLNRGDVKQAGEVPLETVGYRYDIPNGSLAPGRYYVRVTALDTVRGNGGRQDQVLPLSSGVAGNDFLISGNHQPTGVLRQSAIPRLGAAGSASDQDRPNSAIPVTVRISDGSSQLFEKVLPSESNGDFLVPLHPEVYSFPAGTYSVQAFAENFPEGNLVELQGSARPLVIGEGLIESRDCSGLSDVSDTLVGSNGAEDILGGCGKDTLLGEGGDDRLGGGGDDDTVRGGAGGDLLYGGQGVDRLYGDEGDDILEGGLGNDIYFYKKSNGGTFDGADILRDGDGENRLYLVNIEESEVQRVQQGAELRLTFPNAAGNSITIEDYDPSDWKIIYNPVNVVMIFADDLGYGDIESPPFNQQHIRTPHLRAMAQSGLTFENFYSGAAWCPPARNTLMSGKHSGNTFYDNQAPNSWVIWSPDKLLPAMMQEAGYRTGVIGKWGMSSFTSDRNPTDPNLWPGNPEFGLPEEVGFDEFYGFLNHTDAHLYLLDSPATPAQATPYQPYFGVGSHRNASGALVAPLGKRQNLYHIEDGKTVEYSPRFPMTKFTQDEFLERADTFITENRDSPFFLYLPWTIPHAELYLPPSDPAWNYYQGVSFQDSVYFGDQNPVNTWPYLRRVDEPRKTYAAMISRLDRDVKTILDRLAAEGLLDNTLVIFTSDNGPHNASGMRRDDPNDTFSFDSAGGYRGRKGALYEGGIKVPFIVHLPERMRGAHQGTIRSDLAALWDIYPTIAELIEVDLPAAMELDGTSLLPAFEGGQTLERDFLYWENANRAGAPIDFISDSIQAVRKGKWKLVRIDKAGPDDFLLYDLENDPMESTDVAPVSNNCTVVNELKEIMRSEREPVPGGANAWKNPINLNEIVLEYCPPRLDISVNPQRARFEITHLPFQEINWTNTSLLMNGGEVLPDLIAAASSPLVDIQVDEQRGTATIEVFVDLTGQQFDFISCSTESGTGLQRCNQIRHP